MGRDEFFKCDTADWAKPPHSNESDWEFECGF